MFDYTARRARLFERMETEGIDAFFLAPLADLESSLSGRASARLSTRAAGCAAPSSGPAPAACAAPASSRWATSSGRGRCCTSGASWASTGSRVVNELRRVKDADEFAAMQRAIGPAERELATASASTAPGVSTAELVEAVERELWAGGSRCPLFATHVFTRIAVGDNDSGLATARDPKYPTSLAMSASGAAAGSL